MVLGLSSEQSALAQLLLPPMPQPRLTFWRGMVLAKFVVTHPRTSIPWEPQNMAGIKVINPSPFFLKNLQCAVNLEVNEWI